VSKGRANTGDLVVGCDDRKAMMLENLRDAKFRNLHMREVLAQEDASTHRQGTAAPGNRSALSA